MRKSNLYTLVFLCAAMIGVMGFAGIKSAVAAAQSSMDTAATGEAATVEPAAAAESITATENAETMESITAAENVHTPESTAAADSSAAIESTTAMTAANAEDGVVTEQNKEAKEAADISMDDALFIGDSRTVGLMEYAKIEGADFFCTVGMNVFEIHDEPVSVPGVGRMSLTELLENKTYGKIYVMLGINELGYPFDQIVRKYGELVDFIREKQPDAKIIMQANLHVTRSRSDSDKIFNNQNINKLNEVVKSFADRDGVYYLDANVVFDDSDGALSAELSSDNAHLLAKYYVKWGRWIEEQTAELLEKGE